MSDGSPVFGASFARAPGAGKNWIGNRRVGRRRPHEALEAERVHLVLRGGARRKLHRQEGDDEEEVQDDGHRERALGADAPRVVLHDGAGRQELRRGKHRLLVERIFSGGQAFPGRPGLGGFHALDNFVVQRDDDKIADVLPREGDSWRAGPPLMGSPCHVDPLRMLRGFRLFQALGPCPGTPRGPIIPKRTFKGLERGHTPSFFCPKTAPERYETAS